MTFYGETVREIRVPPAPPAERGGLYERVMRVPLTEIRFGRNHGRGRVVGFSTTSSSRLFRRLADAARRREAVTLFVQDGRRLEPESLSALNCYLRTAETMGRMHLPFDRLEAGKHRYAWRQFCAYLGLNFL